jgi:hypothetical protein
MSYQCEKCEGEHTQASDCCRCHGEGWYGDGYYCPCPSGQARELENENEFLRDPGPPPPAWCADLVAKVERSIAARRKELKVNK